MDDYSWKMDPYSLKPLTPPPHHTVEEDEIDFQDFSLVVTGDVFRWMINYAPAETIQRVGTISFKSSQTLRRTTDDGENTSICSHVSG